MINVGQGSAVNLEVEWLINYDSWVQYLDTLGIENNLFNIEVHEEQNEIHYFFQNCGAGTVTSIDLNISQSFSHLLSASQNKDGLKIPIPHRLIKFPISAIRAGWHKYGQNKINCETQHLEHQLKISYAGVNGKKYSSTFKVMLEVLVPRYSHAQDGFHVIAPKDEFLLRIEVEEMD